MPSSNTCENDWPVFVVSLPCSADRRAAIRQQLDQLSCPFTFWDAVDGRNGLPQEYEALIDRPGTMQSMNRILSDGEYACALSHMLIYQKIIDDDLPGAIILEDDATVGSDFARYLACKGYEAAPLIQLYYGDALIHRFGRRVRVMDGHQLRRSLTIAWSTAAYSISRAAAAYLQLHGLPVRCTADWPCEIAPLKPMLIIPKIAGHPPKGTCSMLEEARHKLEEEELQRRVPPPKRARVRSLSRLFQRWYWVHFSEKWFTPWRKWLHKKLTVELP